MLQLIRVVQPLAHQAACRSANKLSCTSNNLGPNYWHLLPAVASQEPG